MRIQASSPEVKPGLAMVTVRPEARTPKRSGAKAKELGKCNKTTGDRIGV